jgi:maltooligosyltrehalose synthase
MQRISLPDVRFRTDVVEAESQPEKSIYLANRSGVALPHQTDNRKEFAAKAKTRAHVVLRDAVATTSSDTVRQVFEQAVTREIAHMLERGAMTRAITAFEDAAAEIHHALCPHGMRPCVACGDQ